MASLSIILINITKANVSVSRTHLDVSQCITCNRTCKLGIPHSFLQPDVESPRPSKANNMKRYE